MKLSPKDIAALRRNGATVTGDTVDNSKDQFLSELLSRLIALVEKPPPTIIVKPPEITVKAPEVTIEAAKPIMPARKWKFVVTKDNYGQTKEIVATAME